MPAETLPEKVDVLVVGAGSAGAAMALHGALGGLKVLCLDRSELGCAGASWVNGVPRSAFSEAGIEPPQGPELRGDGAPFHLITGWGARSAVLEGSALKGTALKGTALKDTLERRTLIDHGVLEVDMRLLVARLQYSAEQAGALIVGGVSVREREGRQVSTSAGVVMADVVVDASGLSGARLLGQPATDANDLCAAAQGVYRIDDPSGALEFLEKHGAKPSETLCFTGVAGGYSILNVSVHGDEVSLLSGSLPAMGYESGTALIDSLLVAQPWIGKRLFGGARAIPLGRPHDRLAKASVALLGDAGRQVFSAHGSGVGPGLVAARMLAKALTQGAGPQEYAWRWQREQGGLLAAYDLFRRYSQALDPGAQARLFSAGLIDESAASATLAQRLPTPSWGQARDLLPSLRRVSDLAPALGTLTARMGALMALYRVYPKAGPTRAWASIARRLAGEASP